MRRGEERSEATNGHDREEKSETTNGDDKEEEESEKERKK